MLFLGSRSGGVQSLLANLGLERKLVFEEELDEF